MKRLEVSANAELPQRSSWRFRTVASSFRMRLILSYVLIAVLIVGSWVTSIYGPDSKATVDQQRSRLFDVAHVVARSLEGTTGTPSLDAARSVSGTNLRLTVVAADGRVLADSATDPTKMENHALRPEIAAALRGANGSDTRKSATLGFEQMYVAIPSTLNGDRVAVRISEPQAAVNTVLAQSRRTDTLLLLGALMVAALAGFWMADSTMKPIVGLRDAAQAMAAGDLDFLVPQSPGEFGELASSLQALRDMARSTIAGLETDKATLWEAAAYDGLTRVASRAHVLEYLRQEIERARRSGLTLAIAMIDLDCFKMVNDTYGHGTGDAVLREAAARMRASLRAGDLVGRVGGEEFLLVLLGDAGAAAATAERVRKSISTDPFVADEVEIPLSASFGVTAVDTEDPDAFVRSLARADAALYEAKHAGRNQVRVSPSGTS